MWHCETGLRNGHAASPDRRAPDLWLIEENPPGEASAHPDQNTGLSPVTRDKVCISFVDVVGFSRLMQQDEDATVHRWTDLRDAVVLPLLDRHNGALVKSTGDGILATFAEPRDGARWSAALQREARQRRQGLALRVSLHYCPVIRDGADLLGDGVNVAARLQEHAASGGVILTEEMAREIADSDALQAREIGPITLRKMGKSVAAYELLTDGRPMRAIVPEAAEDGRPSIAVMPFVSLDGEQSEEYFASGVVEDIVVSLSQHSDLTVVSRSSTLAFARQDIDPRSVGEALGVRYLITGTLRRHRGQMRISTQLIDTQSGTHEASWRRDFGESDTFKVQDEIVDATLTHLLPGLRAAERRRVSRKWPGSFTAFDNYLRGLDLIGSLERREFDSAYDYLQRAMEQDPGFSTPRAWAARWHTLRVGQGWSVDPREDAVAAAQIAMEALRLDDQNALALATYGHVQSYLFGDFDTAIGYLDRARTQNPNSSIAWLLSSVTLSSLGRTDEAVTAAERALRLSPFDQRLYVYYAFLGTVHYDAGNFETAIGWLSRSLAENGRYTSALRTLAVAQVAVGRIDDAQNAVTRLLQNEPDFNLSRYRSALRLYNDPARSDLFRARLKEAGAPD